MLHNFIGLGRCGVQKTAGSFAIKRSTGSKFFEPVARALDRDAMRRSLARQSA
jgi:hypothetical protein